MTYYFEKHSGKQTDLVIVQGLQAIKIQLEGNWSAIVEKAMIRSGAKRRDGTDGYYELKL